MFSPWFASVSFPSTRQSPVRPPLTRNPIAPVANPSGQAARFAGIFKLSTEHQGTGTQYDPAQYPAGMILRDRRDTYGLTKPHLGLWQAAISRFTHSYMGNGPEHEETLRAKRQYKSLYWRLIGLAQTPPVMR